MTQKITPFSPSEMSKAKGSFLASLKEELKKVTWTEKKELQHATKVVLGTTFFFGLGVYLMDLMIKGVLDSLSQIGKWIVGL